MRRRFLEWGLVVVVVAAIGVLVWAGRASVEKFDDLVVGKDRWYELMSVRERVNEGLVGKVSFNREELITAESGSKWYYSLVERQEGAKSPEVKYRADDGVKLAVLEDKITDDLIRSGNAIKVMAYSDSKYELYELFVTTLPIIRINHTGVSDMAKSDEEETMQMEVFDNRSGAVQRVMMADGRIKVRGAGSANYPKKGFRLKLRTMSVGENKRPNNLSLLGMRQDDDWILYAGYNDPEKVRNVYLTNLWKEGQAKDNDFKLDNGVEFKYAELIMNDNYYGLYALGYPVDELVLGLKKASDGKYEEFSFKKYDWDEMGDSPVDTFELETEVENTSLAWNELRKYDELIRYGESSEKIREAVDMRTAENFRLFIEFAQATDNDAKNIYLTAKEWGKGYKWLHTPWDLDLALGNTANGAYEMNAGDEMAIGGVVTKLMELGDTKVSEEMKAQYRKLRENAWSEDSLMEMVDEYEKDIYRSGAFRREMERWPEGNYNDADEELTRFREYLLGRLQTMDDKYL